MEPRRSKHSTILRGRLGLALVAGLTFWGCSKTLITSRAPDGSATVRVLEFCTLADCAVDVTLQLGWRGEHSIVKRSDCIVNFAHVAWSSDSRIAAIYVDNGFCSSIKEGYDVRTFGSGSNSLKALCGAKRAWAITFLTCLLLVPSLGACCDQDCSGGGQAGQPLLHKSATFRAITKGAHHHIVLSAVTGAVGRAEKVEVRYCSSHLQCIHPASDNDISCFLFAPGSTVLRNPEVDIAYMSLLGSKGEVKSRIRIRTARNGGVRNQCANTHLCMGRRSLANILNHYFYVGRITFQSDGFNGYPGLLIEPEVVSEVAPLQPRHDSIGDASYDSGYLNSRLPPLKGAVPFLLGAGLMCWSWFAITESRCRARHAAVFLVGIVCVGYGFWVLLPWSVS